MTPQFFTLEMSRRLSSLVPEFEGHWTYRDSKTKTFVVCGENYVCLCEGGIVCSDHQTICPAWQVEDVLSNLKEIFKDKSRFFSFPVSKRVVRFLRNSSDITTAYQKIEEYLWSVLK